MAGNSSEPSSLSTAMYLYVVATSTEYIIGLPVNSWALGLIFSSKKSLVETEILTVNLLLMEIMSAVCFFSLAHPALHTSQVLLDGNKLLPRCSFDGTSPVLVARLHGPILCRGPSCNIHEVMDWHQNRRYE